MSIVVLSEVVRVAGAPPWHCARTRWVLVCQFLEGKLDSGKDSSDWVGNSSKDSSRNVSEVMFQV